ncbi:MAG: sugar transferase [Candidatus Vogelbacteria bacterium]|nr:sugar transferase [Candidatus Vogelbacteria bacterium]
MRFGTTTQTVFLFLGDLLALAIALWLTLIIRYLGWPSTQLFFDHLAPFAIIFILWSLVFFMYDLYGSRTLFLERKLTSAILNAQVVNIIIALLFFYLIPYFGITPKTNLFIFLVVSCLILLVWRRLGVGFVIRPAQESILFACGGPEVEELRQTFAKNSKYGITVRDGEPRALPQEVSMVVFNSHDTASAPLFANFYRMLFSGVRFANIEDIYEEVYGRVPVSIISERWFLEHLSNQPKPFYDFFKRTTDLMVGLVFGILSLILYPIVFVLIKLETPGPLFSYQTRVGKNNQPINLIKFRTMTNSNDGGVWGAVNKNKVTRVGKILRKTRIDELPQLWNVVRGDISLIGPRPEFADPVEKYSNQIPYYNIRHIIKPGLSGWAQMYHEAHPHHGLDVVETRNKLSYDLYYIKHRSIWLDIKIGLKTVALLLSAKGS